MAVDLKIVRKETNDDCAFMAEKVTGTKSLTPYITTLKREADLLLAMNNARKASSKTKSV
jgi:hypothetical protein